MWIETHGIAGHANTASDTQRHVSTGPAEPKPPDSPTGSTRSYPDEKDGLRSCPGMQRTHIHTQRVTNNSRRSANAIVTLDLPVRGAELCIGEPEWLRSQTNVSNAYKSVANDSRRPTNI